MIEGKGSKDREEARQDFADELVTWRDRNDLTQAQAAEVLKTKISTIEDWEQARTMPYQVELIREVMKMKDDGKL